MSRKSKHEELRARAFGSETDNEAEASNDIVGRGREYSKRKEAVVEARRWRLKLKMRRWFLSWWMSIIGEGKCTEYTGREVVSRSQPAELEKSELTSSAFPTSNNSSITDMTRHDRLIITDYIF